MDNQDSNIPNKLQCVDDWKIKEDLAQWKSLAISLYHENQMLHAHLRDTYMDMIEQEKSKHDDPNCTNHSHKPIMKEVPTQEPLSLVWEGEKPKLLNEVERSEWFTYLYFKRIRRQREIKAVLTPLEDDKRAKKRNKYEESDEEEEEKPLNLVSNERPLELKKLYGTQGSQIGGVEVALQLNYERLRSQMNPGYWPELQLNLG